MRKDFALPLVIGVFFVISVGVLAFVYWRIQFVPKHPFNDLEISPPSLTAPTTSTPMPKQENQKKTISESKNSLTINLEVCQPDEGGFPWGLGSVHVTIKGIQNGFCVYEYTSEIEGGYSKYECKLPTSQKTASISEAGKPDIGDYGTRLGIKQTFDLENDCKQIKSGNYFLDK